MSDEQQQVAWTNKQLLIEAEVIASGLFGIEPVYRLLTRIRDEERAQLMQQIISLQAERDQLRSQLNAEIDSAIAALRGRSEVESEGE